MLESLRGDEISKYVAAYRNPDYRMGIPRKADVVRVIKDLAPKTTLLDVGTGRGETLSIAEAHGIKAVGTEVVPYLLVHGKVIEAHAHALPFDDNAFDHVTCFDVLEHLLQSDIEDVLVELLRVARVSVTVSASSRKHTHNGVELHISARPLHEWHEVIAKAWWPFEAYRNGNAGKASGCWQVYKR